MHIDDSDCDRILLREIIDVTQTPFVCYEADCLPRAQAYFDGGPKMEGLDLCRPPALVLLDYDLGGHTGCDFLRWLRGWKKLTVPVVMFSGSAGRFHVGEGYESGADYFIRKPRGINDLKTIVSTLYLSMVGEDMISSLPEYIADPRRVVAK